MFQAAVCIGGRDYRLESLSGVEPSAEQTDRKAGNKETFLELGCQDLDMICDQSIT